MYVYVCIWICTCICIYVYDSICWALKRPVHCAEQLLELKICISPQFRAIDPPNPARGFIQQNENVRLATAACMQKYGNVSFVTVACAKCMRYGGGVGDHTFGGGGGVGIRDPDSYIYIYTPWESRTIVKMGTASATWSRAAKTLLLKLLKRLHAKESNSV